MAKQKRDVYQEVTDRIVEQLEKGTLPWVKPWKDGNNTACPNMPYNAATKRAYSGINVLLLACMPFASNGWMTFKQAKDRGGYVRKGEQGSMVTLFKPVSKDSGETDENGKPILKGYALLRSYCVFNVEQIEWPEGSKEPEAPEPGEIAGTSADELAAVLKCDLRIQGTKACYIPSADQVHMPALKLFKDQDNYNATLLHELTHWTGHKSRCDRDLRNRFGDDAYAFEELIAEMGAAFLGMQMGIPYENLQHDSYIASWLKVLKDDKKAIFAASSQARQSNEWVQAEVAKASLAEFVQDQHAA